MDKTASRLDDIRNQIISDPEVILEDRDIMRALVAANGNALGSNIVDLRGIALERLETRLARLEDTHRSVIAAAYENLAGTNQIHRAVLELLNANTFEAFLNDLPEIMSQILNVDVVRLTLETSQSEEAKTVASRFEQVLSFVEKGFVSEYLAGGRDAPLRPVTLRQIAPRKDGIYGSSADWIRSEACLLLDLGEGRLPGMLALGAEDPHKFRPTQGTDLLAFFGGVFERTLRQWLY